MFLTGQSKLKALMTTMALQRVRAMEALNTGRQVQNCNSGIVESFDDPISSHSGITTAKKD